MAKKQFLVVTGVPSIKRFVFGTDRLKEIRGASALLEDLTRNRIVEYLNKCPQFDNKIVFVGGGSGQFIIRALEEDLDANLKTLEGEFLKATCGGARLNWGKAEYTGDNYGSALKLAELDAIQKLEETPFYSFPQLHTGFIRECDSCSGMVYSTSVNDTNDDSLLCETCRAKVGFNYQKARKSLLNELSDYLHTKGVYADPPQDFEEIGEQCEGRKGYTALVYADGNLIGKFIKTVNTQKLFGFFSATVDTSIKEACYEALFEVCFLEKDKKPAVIPAEILMLGGDDLLVYLTAEAALPFAVKVAEKFNAITRKKMEASPEGEFFLTHSKNKGLSVSLGVAFGKSHTPFSILLDQAEELLQSAKKAGTNDQNSSGFYTPAYIDYHITSNYNQIYVADSRKNYLEICGGNGRKPIKLYQKPYSLIDAEALIDFAQRLLAAGIPITRLHRIGYAPSLGKMNGTLECLKIYTRTPKQKRRVIWDALARFDCIENMPWHEGEATDNTMLVDLMEIVTFSRKNNPMIKGEADAP